MEPDPVKPGDFLAGKYRVERLLGVGGMGVVVAATHLALGQMVALKLMLPGKIAQHELQERFLREARASVHLKTQHVARVIDVGALENGAPYMVMEYLDGSDLNALLRRRGPLAVHEAIEYLLQACEAIAEAHAAGIVHRDLKPANLFLTTSADGSPCIKVLDFGVSKVMTSELGLTHDQEILGSPFYMSPEQMTASKGVDSRSDIAVDFGGGALASAGDADAFIAKLTPFGKPLWSRRFGDAGFQSGRAIAVDQSGNVIVVGDFWGAASFVGGPQLVSNGMEDIFLVKLSPAGAHLWSKSFGDPLPQHARSLAIDSANNIFLTGDYFGNVDFGGGPLTDSPGGSVFVAQFDPNGQPIWSKSFSDANSSSARPSVAVDSIGNVLLVGSFEGSIDFGGHPLVSSVGDDDIFAAKLDPSGKYIWSQRFGSALNQYTGGIAAIGPNNIVITGNFNGTIDFGGGPLVAMGQPDIFVAKLRTP